MTFLQYLVKSLIELISSPNGSLLYHLVTLFAIYLILGIAFGHWNRHRREPAARRLLLVGVGFATARMLLMLVAVLDLVGLASPNWFLPPLERFLDLATLLLVIWAFLPALEQHTRLGVALLLVAFLMTAGVYAVFASLWPQAEAQSIFYNGYWQETAWELFDIAILTLALIAALSWRRGEWSLVVCLFAVWLAGHILQFALPTFPLARSHIAGWVRASNLVALPLLASLVYRRVLSAGDGGKDTALELISILRSTRRIEAARDVETALGLAASSIARALGADMVAVGLPGVESRQGVRIVAIHPPTGLMLAQEDLELRASAHPLLGAALQNGRQQHARAPRSDPYTATLYNGLGFERPGPLLIQPLTDGGSMLGVMLIGNPVSQRRWTVRDERVVQAMGAAIAAALASVRRREGHDRSAELQKALGEANRLAQRAVELENELEHQRQRAGEMATKLRLQERDSAARDQSVAEAAIWQAEINELAEARAALEAELAEWKDKAEQLAHSKDDLQMRLAQVQADLKDAQRQEQTSIEWKEKAEQLARSRDDLQDKLAQVQTNIQEAQSQTEALAEWKEKAEQFARSRDELQSQLTQVKAELQEMRSQAVALASTEQPTGGRLGGTLLGDEQGNIIMVSQGAQHLIGKSRSVLAGTSLYTLFDQEPLWPQAVDNLLREGVQAGEAVSVTLELGGKMVRAELTRLPGVTGVPGVLAIMLYPEEEGGAVQTEMVASLINELRTPMTSITGYTDLLLGETVGILGEMQRQFLLRVQANIERMGRLLNDLIRVTTIDTGQILLSPEPIDIVSVVEDAIMSLSVEFSERKLTVQLNMPPTLPPVEADRDSLYQIVLNLLSNASQCSRSETEILVSAKLEERDDQIVGLPDYLLVSIADTGGGISSQDQRRVFQRLYRADNPLINGLGETGVGLSIAKALVEANGGRIWVESEMGVGSVFSFILPISSKGADGFPPGLKSGRAEVKGE